MATWILCPNLWGARLFWCDQPHEPECRLQFVREFPRPRIQTKREDLRDDDEASDIEQPVESAEVEQKVAHEFMQTLAGELEKACTGGRFEALVLCAEPHLLGILMAKLGPCAGTRVIGSVPQDLYEVNESDLRPYIEEVIRHSRTRGRQQQRAPRIA